MLKKNLRFYAIAMLLVSLMLVSSLTLFSSNMGFAQEDTMTFTSGEKINFSSTTEMTFKSPTKMTFGTNVTMKFGTGIRIGFIESIPNGILEPCDWIQIIWTWPEGYVPLPCSWWEALDPYTGEPIGEFHIDDWQGGPNEYHIDNVYTVTGGPISIPLGEEITAEKKIMIVEPCSYFVVHWPEHWWPPVCSWWEIIDPDTGKLSGFEFHVDWTNESCEFHVDEVYPGPWGPWQIGAYEVEARQKITDIKPCDYFVVEEPTDWWPKPCTWWEIMDPYTREPTGLEFHVDWTNESCEFHVDQVYPDPIGGFKWFPPTLTLTAEQKVADITACDWFIIVDPVAYLPEPCSWWEILDDTGEPTGLEFHVDQTNGIDMFHVDKVYLGSVIQIPPSYTVTVRKKIDSIQPCDWFKVDDPALTPEVCSWWEVLDPVTGGPTGLEFHVDVANQDGTFHVDSVYPGLVPLPTSHELTAEKKIDGISPCDWFKVIDPPTGWVPEPCSWWEITWPEVWAGIIFHVDSNNGVEWFHIDEVDGDYPAPTPPPWNVTAKSTEPPPLPWHMKPPYPDYARSGMPDFDQRQGGTYLWQDLGGRWSHCGPVAVANSLWWLDSEFETNTIPPPTMIDNYPLVGAYGPWDDHDPQNVPPLVEHLAYLMDTDGLRTGIVKLGTNVFDMQAGITHYLSWSGVNPLGDVDGDGIVTQNDVDIVSAAYNTVPGDPRWDLRADIFPATISYPPVADNYIDIDDAVLVALNLGATGQFYEHTVMAPIWDIIVEEVLRCQDVVLLIAPWIYDQPTWYRYDEGAHFVTVAGLNATTWEIVLSDPIRDNAEAGGAGDVPVPHVHSGPEPPYATHNNATLVSHDMYPVFQIPCPGGPLTIVGYAGSIISPPGAFWQIEAAVITSPLVRDVAVIDVTPYKNLVCQGYPMRINATVENQGSVTEANFDVTVKANDTVVDTLTVLSLAPSAQTTLTFTWDASGFAKGNYTISAVAAPVPGETDTGDNTFVDGTVIVSYPGDINGPGGVPDGLVDIDDVIFVAIRFGSVPGWPNWDPIADLTDDDLVDIDDVMIPALRFGEIDP